MAAAEIRRRKPVSQRRRDGLIQFAKDKTSQNGEDGVIEKLFELLPPPSSASASASVGANGPSERWCVDVGAWDGKHLSNTYSLAELKWRGVYIEADPIKFQDLRKLHPNEVCLNVMVTSMPSTKDSLVQVLRNTPLPNEFDFLCIDVDGSDYHLLQQLLASVYRPQVVCVEFNPTMPNDIIYIPPQSDQARHGASLAALVELSQSYQYTLVETTLYNAFFVPDPLYRQYLQGLVRDTTIEALHEVTMGTQLYQLYDGTIKLWGCKKLLWHRKTMEEQKLQVLSAKERIFPFAPTAPPPPPSSPQVEGLHNMQDAVDMSAYCCPNNTTDGIENLRLVARTALWDQLSRTGFCKIRGTGLSSRLVRSALACCRALLHDAPESVRRSALCKKDRARRGYSPMCTENFASLLGQPNQPNDLVRKFRMGRGGGESVLQQPNVWPSTIAEEGWERGEEFEPTISDYYEQACPVADVIVQALCDAAGKSIQLNQQQQQQQERHEHTSILTLLGYQVGSRHRRRKQSSPLVAPHTDVGVITMLIFDAGDCATLQRHRGNKTSKKNSSDDERTKEDEGDWIDVLLPRVVPEDPVFVINIGDCLSELLGLPSTLHRVVPSSKGTTPRNCLALFVGLDSGHLLRIQNNNGGSGEEEIITYEEWRKRRIAKAQAVLKN